MIICLPTQGMRAILVQNEALHGINYCSPNRLSDQKRGFGDTGYTLLLYVRSIF